MGGISQDAVVPSDDANLAGKTRRDRMPGRVPLGFRLLLALVPSVLPFLTAVWTWCVHTRVLNRDIRDRFKGRPYVGVLWHQHMLFSLHFLHGRRGIFLSSLSKDGEISTRFLRRLGHAVVRGSSSRGGSAALRELTRLLQEGHPAIITADGPRGPAREAKLGCVAAARDAGVPILPMAVAIKGAHHLRSWDRTALPYPFTSAVIAYGEPFTVAADASREACEEARREVERRIAALETDCRRAL